MPKLLDTYTKDFHRLQSQKSRHNGGIEARILLNLCFYFGEHYVSQTRTSLTAPPVDVNKLHLVFNMLRKAIRAKIGRLMAGHPEFPAIPDSYDPRAFAKAEVVTKLVKSLDRTLRQPMRTWEILWWLLLGGVAVERTDWEEDVAKEPLPQFTDDNELIWLDTENGNAEVPESQVDALVQQGRIPESFTVKEELMLVGEVGSRIFSPFNIFVDSSVTDLQKLAGDQAVYTAEIKTLGWIKDNFGNDKAEQARGAKLDVVKTGMKQLGPTFAGTNMHDLIPAVQGTKGQHDPEMALVATRYQMPTKGKFAASGRETIFVPGMAQLEDRPSPYGGVPLIDYHWEPPTVSFWTGDYMTDMIPGQKFLNKRFSQLGEQANAAIYDLMLLGPDLVKEDIPTDFPGKVEGGVDEAGNPMVQRVPGPQLPGWFLESIKMTIDFLQELGGATLLNQKKFPGQLRGPTGVPMLQEILDSEDGPLYMHLGEQMAAVKQMRVQRVKDFYPAVRTLNLTGRQLRDEVLVFHTDTILRAGTEFSITVDESTVTPELLSLREARVTARLNSPLALLYMNERTQQLDPTKIAADLKYGNLGREGRVAQYRKLGIEIVGRLWQGKALPQPLDFWDQDVMLDELEAAMATTEFFGASPQVQEGFFAYYNLLRDQLQQKADAQTQSMQSQMMQSAVAQAVQQTAAQVAAKTVSATTEQVQAQQQVATEEPSLQDTLAQLLGQGQPLPDQGV